MSNKINDASFVAKKQFVSDDELKAKIKRFLPKGTSIKVTDEIIKMVKNMGKSIGVLDEYMEEKFFTYLPVLKEGKFSLKDYINALKYCTLKKTMKNIRAWELVFPEKYRYLEENGMQISAHVSIYNSSKLVTLLDARMMTELHLQYAPIFHEAIARTVDLMRGVSPNGAKVSANVQQQAAAKLMDVLAPPKDDRLSITIGADDETKKNQLALVEQLKEIAKQQQAMLKAGASLSDIQKLNLKAHDVKDAEIEE